MQLFGELCCVELLHARVVPLPQLSHSLSIVRLGRRHDWWTADSNLGLIPCIWEAPTPGELPVLPTAASAGCLLRRGWLMNPQAKPTGKTVHRAQREQVAASCCRSEHVLHDRARSNRPLLCRRSFRTFRGEGQRQGTEGTAGSSRQSGGVA